MQKEKVIIDTDMGQVNDDAITLFMLANSEQVEIVGVTIVAGNTWVEEGTAYTLRQLELMGRTDISVVPGAVEPLMGNRQPWLEAEERLYGNVEYLGAFARPRPTSYLELHQTPLLGYPETEPKTEHAVDFIVREIKENPYEITLFVLGPATNIALAVRKNPEIIPLVKKIIYMGGAIDIPGNTTPAAEFNFWFDPESAKIALRCPFREQVIVPNDIAEQILFTRELYDRISEAPETSITKMFKYVYGPRFSGNPSHQTFVWDVLTAAIFLRPEIVVRMEERYIDIDTSYGPNYGRSIGYHESRRRSFAVAQQFPAATQKVQVLFEIDRDAFWNLYIELVTKKVSIV